MTSTLHRDLGGRIRKVFRFRLLKAFTAAALLVVIAPTFAQAQRPPSREIVAEDFTKNRTKTSSPGPDGGILSNQPSASQSSASDLKTQGASKVKKRVYRLASSSKESSNSRPITKASSPPHPARNRPEFEQLGITIWRLRPAKPGDSGARMLVMEDSNSSEWVPERIEADTPLKFGDHLRLSVESPRTGYLYVVDRDLFADGTKGDAMLIFPTHGTRGGDNQVRAGKLIEIPAQDDRQSYFIARPVRGDQVGEVLSIIVTTSPLNIPISENPLKISHSEIAQWERSWAAPLERFEMVGGAGQTWTNEEKQAAASTDARQLTQDGPSPQTIYRVSTANNSAFLVNVRLSYGR